MIRLAIGGIGLVLLAAACHLPVHDGFTPIPPSDPRYDSDLQIQFLGVSGFLLRRGSDAILTAPLYSHPSIRELDAANGRMRTKVERIDAWHPEAPDVRAILVGHAHYDHLMDVPWIWERSPSATIYGNASTANILSGYTVNAANDAVPLVPSDRIRVLNSSSDPLVDYRMCVAREGPVELEDHQVERERARGAWVGVPGARVRIRALCSYHPPQVLKLIHLWPGSVHRPRYAPPDSSADYEQGETLAYLIDFLDADGEPTFRVYYQDAPTSPTIAQVAPELLEEKRVDVALLCVGNFFDVDDPTHIVRTTRPRVVVLGHWENFMKPPRFDPEPIPFANVGKVVEAVRRDAGPDVAVYLPNLQATFNLSPES